MDFSIQSCLRFGWETFKKRPWIFVGASLLIGLVYLLASVVEGVVNAAVSSDPEGQAGPGALIDLVVSTFVGIGGIAFYLKAHDNVETADIGSLWHPQGFWSYLAATILVGLAVVAGIILLIVPGIIFMLMFLFSTVIVVDRELGPIEAMKESRLIAYGHKWQLLGFVLVLVLVNLAGLLALVVGLFVSIPVSTLAFMHAYRILGGPKPPVQASL